MNRPEQSREAALRWPVISFDPACPVVAIFDDYDSAIDFVNTNLGKRNLYIGEPRRIKRAVKQRLRRAA